MAMPDFPTQAIGFVLSAEAAAAFDDLTRSKEGEGSGVPAPGP